MVERSGSIGNRLERDKVSAGTVAVAVSTGGDRGSHSPWMGRHERKCADGRGHSGSIERQRKELRKVGVWNACAVARGSQGAVD